MHHTHTLSVPVRWALRNLVLCLGVLVPAYVMVQALFAAMGTMPVWHPNPLGVAGTLLVVVIHLGATFFWIFWLLHLATTLLLAQRIDSTRAASTLAALAIPCAALLLVPPEGLARLVPPEGWQMLLLLAVVAGFGWAAGAHPDGDGTSTARLLDRTLLLVGSVVFGLMVLLYALNPGHVFYF